MSAHVTLQHPALICVVNGSTGTGQCRFQGQYHPPTHVVLYCEHCARWYHRECVAIMGPLAGLQMEEPEILPDFLVFGEDANEVGAQWQRLRAVPIQRRYPEQLGTGFATFESILLAAREHGSDAPETAAVEIAQFFSGNEIVG